MQGKPESEYAKQERWRADALAFIFALLKHWVWWLSVTIGSGFVAFVAAWMQGLPGGGKVIPFWVFGTAAATGLVAASFRAFCGQRRIAEAKELELQALKNEIKPLKSQLDDREKRRKIKEYLGNWQLNIKGFYDALSADETLFDGEDRQTFEQEYSENENSMASYLHDNVGSAEVASFLNDSGIEEVNPETTKTITNNQFARKKMLNLLKYRIKRLEIIHDKLDSKDFILPLDNSK